MMTAVLLIFFCCNLEAGGTFQCLYTIGAHQVSLALFFERGL